MIETIRKAPAATPFLKTGDRVRHPGSIDAKHHAVVAA